MSGFLDRLVARHAAEPAIRPRARSRFEGGAALVALPVESAPAAASRTPADSPEPLSSVPLDARAAKHAESFARSTSPRSASARPDSAVDDAETPAHGRAAAPAVAPVTRSVGATRLEASAPPSSARPSGADAFGEVRTSASTRRAKGAEPSEHALRDLDVVRVHIGRVEVRAVLPPAETPRAPRAPEPRPLSLERFLARKDRP